VIKVKLNKKECPRNDGLATNSFICFRGAAVAKVAKLHSKRVSIPGISEALGLSIEQVEEDLDYIERSMSQAIQAHTANVNQDDNDIPMTTEEEEYEKACRKFHMTGDYEPKNSGGYVAIFR
jgi:hypothetical protein